MTTLFKEFDKVKNKRPSPTFINEFPPLNKSVDLRQYIDQKKSYFFVKRAVDVAGSIIFIFFILSWVYPIMALLIKLESGGPVLFKQKRVGRGGRTFLCYKFRTMIVNTEADKTQAVKNDSRITRFGHFLRDSNIDEFPQFFNVLIGDMSLVGPRPHMLSDCVKFSSIVEGYKFRNLVKPGLTGMAQVKGFHGPITSSEGVFSRFKWDALYIHEANFWLDTHIILKTAAQQIQSIWAYTTRRKRADLAGMM